MTFKEAFTQLKAFARIDGVYLSLIWVVSFLFTMRLPNLGIGNLLALSTPLVVGWYVSRYRDRILEGELSFRRGFAYIIYMFLYACLLFALAQFLYFEFLDNGSLQRMLVENMQILEPAYKQSGIDSQQLKASIQMMLQLSAFEWAGLFFVQNMMLGVILALPVAAFCTRRKAPAHIAK